MPNNHIVDHDELVEILEVVARSDLDMADMLGRQYGLSTQELQYVQTGDRSVLDSVPADELLPGCCTCCSAAIERQDPIGHGPHLLRCPCLPVDECTPIVEGFADPDGNPAARLLVDLPHLGLASGSEWMLTGARR